MYKRKRKKQTRTRTQSQNKASIAKQDVRHERGRKGILFKKMASVRTR